MAYTAKYLDYLVHFQDSHAETFDRMIGSAAIEGFVIGDKNVKATTISAGSLFAKGWEIENRSTQTIPTGPGTLLYLKVVQTAGVQSGTVLSPVYVQGYLTVSLQLLTDAPTDSGNTQYIKLYTWDGSQWLDSLPGTFRSVNGHKAGRDHNITITGSMVDTIDPVTSTTTTIQESLNNINDLISQISGVDFSNYYTKAESPNNMVMLTGNQTVKGTKTFSNDIKAANIYSVGKATVGTNLTVGGTLNVNNYTSVSSLFSENAISTDGYINAKGAITSETGINTINSSFKFFTNSASEIGDANYLTGYYGTTTSSPKMILGDRTDSKGLHTLIYSYMRDGTVQKGLKIYRSKALGVWHRTAQNEYQLAYQSTMMELHDETTTKLTVLQQENSELRSALSEVHTRLSTLEGAK